jgi:hypothetical protein
MARVAPAILRAHVHDAASGLAVLTLRAAISASSASTTVWAALPFSFSPTVKRIGLGPLGEVHSPFSEQDRFGLQCFYTYLSLPIN